MSDIQKHKDFKKLRDLAKKLKKFYSVEGVYPLSEEHANTDKEFDKLWEKYGCKYGISSRRRLASHRKTSARNKKSSKRREKRINNFIAMREALNTI